MSDINLLINKVTRKSLIKKYISDELYIDVLKTTLISDVDNNEKYVMIKDIFTKYNIPWSALGTGTNRATVNIDGYCLEFALDYDGMIDNRREFLYSKSLQPYAVKVYECTPSGLFCIEEYVDILDKSDFDDPSVQKEMRDILSELSQMFLIGDIGINPKNYVNWGRRPDGSLVMLDFAYIYDVKYGTFTCDCDDETILQYDNNYDKLICPKCGKKYDFGTIRRRITRKMQEAEIGDIRRLSYNIHSAEEEVDLVKEFEPEDPNKKKKKNKKSYGEELLEIYYKENLDINDEEKDYWDQD